MCPPIALKARAELRASSENWRRLLQDRETMVAINSLAAEHHSLPDLSDWPDATLLWTKSLNELQHSHPQLIQAVEKHLKQLEANAQRQAVLADQRAVLQMWGAGDFQQAPADYVAFCDGAIRGYGDDPVALRQHWAAELHVPVQRVVIKYTRDE